MYKLIYSLLSVLGISLLLENYPKLDGVIPNNFIFVILFFVFLFFINNAKITYNKRNIIYSSIFSFIISFILVVGSRLELNYEAIFTILSITNIISLMIMLVPIIIYLFNFKIKDKKTHNFKNKKFLFLKLFILIWLCGFLGWLALYPGGYDYDAPAQIRQFLYKSVNITTHYSVLFSYIEYLVISTSYKIFKSYQAAIGLFTLLQMTVVALITSYTTYFIAKETNYNKILTITALLFYCLFPFHILLQVSCVQDTLFSCSMLIFMIQLYKLINHSDIKKKNIIILALSGMLMTLFRNNGIYILLFSLVCSVLIKLLFKIKFNFKIYNVLLVFIIVLYYFYSLIFIPLANIKSKDSLREMSSIPSQQLASAYNYSYHSFTNKELELLNKFYPSCKFWTYTVRKSNSDGIKRCLNQDYTKKHFDDYIGLYISIGKKNPILYGEAFLLHTLGYWYPNKSYPDERIFHPYIEYQISKPHRFNKNLIQIKRSSKFKPYEKLLNFILNQNKWQSIPLFSSICSIGTYFILILYLLFLALYRKRHEYLLYLSIYIGLYITLFLSPVALYRYVYPVVIALPLLLLLMYNLYTDK